MNSDLVSWMLARGIPRPVIVLSVILFFLLACVLIVAIGALYILGPVALVALATQNVLAVFSFVLIWWGGNLAVFMWYDHAANWLNDNYPPRKTKEESED